MSPDSRHPSRRFYDPQYHDRKLTANKDTTQMPSGLVRGIGCAMYRARYPQEWPLPQPEQCIAVGSDSAITFPHCIFCAQGFDRQCGIAILPRTGRRPHQGSSEIE